MKTLFIFLLLGFFSFGQNEPKVIHKKKPSKIEYRRWSDSDSSRVTPPAPPNGNIAIDPQIMEEEIIVVSDVIEFPDEPALFPCHTFYNYDTLGNVIGDYQGCGATGMMTFLSQNVVYPEISIEMNQQGKVYVSFIVEKDGSITNVKILRGVSRDLDREAKRVVGLMPNWIPAKSGGNLVRSRANLPIYFRLN